MCISNKNVHYYKKLLLTLLNLNTKLNLLDYKKEISKDINPGNLLVPAGRESIFHQFGKCGLFYF